MNILEDIKRDGATCPICSMKLETRLIVQEMGNKNILSFAISECKYPIKFVRHACFNAPLEAEISKDGILTIQKSELSFGKYELSATCKCKKYVIQFFNIISIFDHEKSGVIDVSYMIRKHEKINIDDIVIKNDAEFTTVMQKVDKYYERWLFTIGRKPISYWSLNNPEELRNKINKLLVLV